MTDIPDMDLVDVIVLDDSHDLPCQERHPVGRADGDRRTIFERCDRDAELQFVYDIDGQDAHQRVDYCWRCALPHPRDDFDIPPYCGKGHGLMTDISDEDDATRWVCDDCDAVFIPGGDGGDD